MESLTEKVLAYQKSEYGLEKLVEALSPRIYRYPRRKLGWDDDACGDFYLYFQPRLLRLLSRFKDQGKPFETYLCSVLNWQLKNFARERRSSERGWSVALTLQDDEVVESLEGMEGEALPDVYDARIVRVLEKESDRRNFLLLCLKCVRSLTSEKVTGLSALTGISEEKIESYVTALKTHVEVREYRLECFRLRRNRAFSQSRLLETELFEETDFHRREALCVALEKTRRRMRTAMDRMSRIMLNPTNREIAEVLCIPKGTVDSGLYWLKKKLSSVYDPSSLQSA